MSLALERCHCIPRPLILPDDGVRDGPAGLAIPGDDRLALVGERHARSSPFDALFEKNGNIGQKLFGVVLDPTRMRMNLPVPDRADDLAVACFFDQEGLCG